jgi:hypothetical protein
LGDEIEEEIISSKREKLAERDETCWLDFCFLARSVTRFFWQNIFFKNTVSILTKRNQNIGHLKVNFGPFLKNAPNYKKIAQSAKLCPIWSHCLRAGSLPLTPFYQLDVQYAHALNGMNGSQPKASCM